MKKGVLKNFANFTGKHCICWTLFNKVADFRPAMSIKRTPALVFSLEISEILKNTYFQEHLRTTGSI